MATDGIQANCEGLPILWDEHEKSSCNVSIAPENSRGIKSFTIYSWSRDEIGQILKELPNGVNVIAVANDDQENFSDIESEFMQTSLFVALYYEQHIKLQKLLDSNSDVDINSRDMRGRTLLHLACYLGDREAASILIDHGAEINAWDDDGDVMPLHCAAFAGSAECIQILIQHNATVNIENCTKSSPLYYAVQKNAVDCVEILLAHGAWPYSLQVYTKNPLHLAASGGFYECMNLLLQNGAKNGINAYCQSDTKRYTALHFCALENHSDCAKLLLDFGAGVDHISNDNETPLHIACLEQCSETAAVLIEHGANVNLTYDNGKTALHAAINKKTNFWDCLKLLLDAKINVNQADAFGYTPLHTAALNDLESCVLLLINNGADITARTNGNVSALSIISRRLPNVIPKYLEKIDSCISVNGDYEMGDLDFEVRLDFRFLLPHKGEQGEMSLLLAFLEVGQKCILKHPLCSAFLYLKWASVRKFFLFSLINHFIFVILFSLFVLSYFCSVHEKNSPFDNWLNQHISILAVLVIALNACACGKELFQMAHGIKGYVLNWENWLQWLNILGIFLTTSFRYMDYERVPEYKYHLGAIVIFLVWLELMMIIGRFPIFGIYVEMFTKVAMDFLKFLGAYCCLIIAFALSFRILFTYHRTFLTLIRSVFKSMVMMAGDINFEDIFYNDHTILPNNHTTSADIIFYNGTTQIMFISFVFLVTIIVTNLLVGMAVSDIQSLMATATLNRLSRQAELVARLERVVYSKVFHFTCSRIQILFRKFFTFSKTCLIIKPNRPNSDKLLPDSIMKSIKQFVLSQKNDSSEGKSRYSTRSVEPKPKMKLGKVRYQLSNKLKETPTSAISANVDENITKIVHQMELFYLEMQDIQKTLNRISKCIEWKQSDGNWVNPR